MPNTRENLVELLKSTPIAEINGHIAKADVCFVSHVFESFADHLVANGVTVQKWIPVAERLPQRNAEVLVCDTSEDYVSVWEYMGEGLWFGNDVIWATEDLTHWMPLPEAPKE